MKHYAECNQFLEILTILEYIFIVNVYARQKIKKKYVKYIPLCVIELAYIIIVYHIYIV